jgi:hypothetical protein
MCQIVTLVAVINLIAERYMTIGSDIQTKDNLFAVRTEIFIVAMFKVNGLGIRVIVFAFKGNFCCVVVDFICN